MTIARAGVLAVLALLAGCGYVDDMRPDLKPSPPGLYVDPSMYDFANGEMEYLKVCMGVAEGSVDELSIAVHPGNFPCKHYDGICSGEFVAPNLIRIGYAETLRHELIHYLLLRNYGDMDMEHSDDGWLCRWQQ